MTTLLINKDFLSNIIIITNRILRARGRWNNNIYAELFNKTIFKLILIDYYYMNQFKYLYKDLNINLADNLSLDNELVTNLENNINFDFKSYIKNILDNRKEKGSFTNLNSVIEHYITTRELLSNFLFIHIKNSNFNVKKQIIMQIKNWYENITNAYHDFYFNIKVNLSPINNSEKLDILFSHDMYNTFRNSLDQIKNSNNKVLSISSYINYVPMMLWFESFEITIVSNNVSQLKQFHHSLEQFESLEQMYQFNPVQSIKKLSKFNVLYDDILKLDRFGEKENHSYDGIMCNFILSEPNANLEALTYFFSKLKELSNPNSLILFQEESKHNELISKAINNCKFKVLLKIVTFEGFDRTNWIIKIN